MMEGVTPNTQSLEGLPRDAALDEARARELYKYFRPPAADGESPDTILVAHAQLVAWRLNAQRAMITLVDQETQYFVAESTKTLSLDNSLQHDHPDDAIWAGCSRVPKEGKLCEYTMATLPPPNGGPACFEVLDLAQDARFDALEFVAGPPNFRNYAGVPLRTRNGIVIGSLFVIDSTIRPSLTQGEKDFLGVVANNIIQYLEMIKDQKDRERNVKMNSCMSMYVDPSYQPALHGSASHSRSEPPSSSSSPEVKIDLEHTDGHSERLHIFRRAADLLLEAMDLDEHGGGVVFLDTLPLPGRGHLHSDASDEEEREMYISDQPMGGAASDDAEQSSSEYPFQKTYTHQIRTAGTLAHAHQPAAASESTMFDNLESISLSPEDLSKLVKRYPRGKLFTFDTTGQALASSSDDHPVVSEPAENTKRHIKSEAKKEAVILRNHFPMARQIIFLPLWDSTASRPSVCVAYNCSQYRNFSRDLEFLYCVTFNNCVIADITRLANVQADQQKTNFIASVSHELRSPLHGILASCEFLQDTECNSFQRSLVETADGCARTLLDTINMVLDYSKINKPESNTQRSRKATRDLSANSRARTLQPNLSTYSDFDVAALVEEVIIGVAAAYTLGSNVNRSGVQGFDGAETRSSDSDLMPNPSPCKDNVELIVDFAMQDWACWSEPGALRRIVVNLVDNALKYTEAGFVHVKLESQANETHSRSRANSCMLLTVTDSGRGISSTFMRDKLFIPFAQETDLTPGTGLGLALVKSLVDALSGHVNIESSIGVGTKVIVQLPMTRMPRGARRDTNSLRRSLSGNAVERIKVDYISKIQAESSGKTIAICWLDEEGPVGIQQKASQLMCESLAACLREWFGFTVSRWHKDFIYDIIISDEVGLSNMLHSAPKLFAPDCEELILAICTRASPSLSKTGMAKCTNVVEVCSPFGPVRLSRGLKTCLEKLKSRASLELGSSQVEDPPAAQEPNQLPVIEIATAVPVIISSGDSPGGNLSNSVLTGESIREDRAVPQAPSHQDPSVQTTDSTDQAGNPFEATVSAESNQGRGTEGVTDHINVNPATALNVSSAISPFTSTAHEDIPIRGHSTTESNKDTSVGDVKLTNRVSTVSNPSNQQPKLLLVEDNPINLRILLVYTKKRGYKDVTKAENGLEAVTRYRDLLHATPPQPPNIILMDISMPVMNGFEATRQIRKLEHDYNTQSALNQPPQTSLIIALTGLSSERDQEEAFASGVDMYIMKPVNFAKLSPLLEGWETHGETHGRTVMPRD